jgi:hypothetical protein
MYLDPGFGSMLIQGLIAVAGSSFYETVDTVFYENNTLLRRLDRLPKANGSLATDGMPIPTGRTPLSTGRTPLSTGRTPLSTGRTPLSTGRTPLSTGRTSLSTGRTPLSIGRTPLSTGITPLSTGRTPLVKANHPLPKANEPAFFNAYLQFLLLNQLLSGILAPWSVIDGLIVKAAGWLAAKRLNAEDAPQAVSDKTAIYGDTYDGADQWYADALLKTFTEAGPRFTIRHDAKARDPFIRNEDGSLETRAEAVSLDPDNCPSQHWYAAKIVLAYIALILEHDPDAVIVVQAGRLHHNKNREILLKTEPGDERGPHTGNMGRVGRTLGSPGYSRVLVNRYAGSNYSLVTAHP